MKSRILFLSIAILAIAVGLWLGGWGDEWIRSPLPSVPNHALGKSPTENPTDAILVTAPSSTTKSAPGLSSVPEAAVAPKGSAVNGIQSMVIESPSEKPNPELMTAVAVQIDQIGLMFRDYRTLMGSNPVGTNAEIIQAVSGGNPKKARLGPPEGQQINGRGELVDTWGTAYFFHQKSATDMEIHSAGPDKQFGTSDDLIGR